MLYGVVSVESKFNRNVSFVFVIFISIIISSNIISIIIINNIVISITAGISNIIIYIYILLRQGSGLFYQLNIWDS